MMIYHGSNQIVKNPQILVQGYYKDFGYGFYCTKLKKQAIRWAMLKKEKHIVNEYECIFSTELKIKSFEKMTDEWLDFIAACRNGIEHDFDIVEGPMADDTVWNYVEDYLEGRISRLAFWELAKFKYPTHQVVFCTKKSLESLSFIGSEIYEE